MPKRFGLAQAITDHRARLSNSYSSDPLQMDEQNIVMNGTNNTVICPSNGYTFQRNPTQARVAAVVLPHSVHIAAMAALIHDRPAAKPLPGMLRFEAHCC